MIPRDTYRDIPQPTSIDEVPLDRWKELGADGVLVGSVRKTPTGVTVQFRLINVASGTIGHGEGIHRQSRQHPDQRVPRRMRTRLPTTFTRSSGR